MNKPSIAILHYSAPPVVGGVEAVIQAHAGVFNEAGYPVTVIAGRGDKNALPEGVNLLIVSEMDNRDSQNAALSGFLDQGQVPVGFEAAVELLVQRLEPVLRGFDRVIVHNIFTKHFNLPLTAALHRMIDRGLGGVIAWCHDFTWTSPHSATKVYSRYPWDLLSRYRQEVIYVTVSQRRQVELAELLQAAEENVRVIYNGVDEAEILGLDGAGLELVHRLGLLEADLALLLPVRVTEAKNIEYALEVAAALKAAGVGLRMVLTGPPDPHDEGITAYYQSLVRLREELDLVEEMRFIYELGVEGAGLEIGQDIVAQLYRACDAVLIPSRREGFGMPVLEAGLVGIPIFCTRFPAAEEIGGEDIHFIEEGETPQETARGILQWMESDPIHHLRETVRQEYTWRNIFKCEIEPLLSE
jgi:glycosyltransferase involved in cell wall biosynthesis